MITGERIKYLRKLRGITQKELGMAVGFPEKTADVRIAQYESGSRSPKKELTEELAGVLKVSPAALNVPDIETVDGIIQSFFALEDMYGLEIGAAENDIVLRIRKKPKSAELHDALVIWLTKAIMARNGDISLEEYDNWRYNFSEEKGVIDDTFSGHASG